MTNKPSFDGIFKAKLRDNNTEYSEDDYKRFCRQLNASFSKGILNLSGQRIGINVLTKLSKLMRANQHVTSFNFYGNLIRDHGIHSLTQLLLVNTQVRVLDIGCNDLTNQAVPSIIDIIRDTNIESIQIGTTGAGWHNNKFTVQALIDIVTAVKEADKIQCLGLSGLPMSTRVGARKISMNNELADFVSKESALRSLSIASVGFPAKEQAVVSEGILQNRQLKYLDMHDSFLPDPYGSQFTARLSNMQSLTYLDLHKCQLTDLAGIALSDSLKVPNNLIVLDISENNIGDNGFISIAEALLTNDTITEINFAANGITEDSAYNIAEVIRTNKIICSLDLSKNPIKDSGAFAIAQSISSNDSITKLSLASCRFTDKGVLAISKALKVNKTLKTIKLNDNFLTRECGYSILEKIRGNESLFVIDLSATQIDHFVLQAIENLCKRNKQIQREQDLQPLKKQLVQLSIQRTKMPEAEMRLKNLHETREQLEEDVIDAQNAIEKTREDADQQLGEKNKAMMIEREMTAEEMKAKEKNLEERQKMIETYESEYKDIIASSAKEDVLTQKFIDDAVILEKEIKEEKSAQQQEEFEIEQKLLQMKQVLEETLAKVKDPEQLRTFVAPEIDFAKITGDPVFLVDKIDELKAKELDESKKKGKKKRKKSPTVPKKDDSAAKSARRKKSPKK